MGRHKTNDTCWEASLGMAVFRGHSRWQLLASSQRLAKGDGERAERKCKETASTGWVMAVWSGWFPQEAEKVISLSTFDQEEESALTGNKWCVVGEPASLLWVTRSLANGDGAGASQTRHRLTLMALASVCVCVDTPERTVRSKLRTLVARASSCICLAVSGSLVFLHHFFHSCCSIRTWIIFTVLCVTSKSNLLSEYLGVWVALFCFKRLILLSFKTKLIFSSPSPSALSTVHVV